MKRCVLVTLCVFCPLALAGWNGAPRESADGWNALKEAIARDPAILRFHLLTTTPEQGFRADDLSNRVGSLDYAIVPAEGAPAEALLLAQGLWPGSAALRLDRGVLQGPAVVSAGRPFTVELWFRKHGPGWFRGNNQATNGTLVSEGNGYWDGWRVTTSYPEGTFGFEIGRPQPQGSAGFFGCGPLPDGTWHHLAAVWDLRTMRLYLDGLLMGWGDYAGALIPGDRFRVGYADAGWGSVRMDVNAVAVFGRARNPLEILRSALSPGEVSEAPMAVLAEAQDHVAAGRFADAIARYTRLSADPSVPIACRTIAQLGLAFALEKAGRRQEVPPILAQAARSNAGPSLRITALQRLLRVGNVDRFLPEPEIEKLLALPELSPEDRKRLRVDLARARVRSGSPDAARMALRDLAQDNALAPGAILQLRLEAAHRWRAGARLAEAEEEYRAILSAPDVPAPMRWRARLGLLEVVRRRKGLAAVRAEYERLRSDPQAPLAARREAADALLEGKVSETTGKPAQSKASWTKERPAALAVRPVSFAHEIHVAPRGDDRNPGTRERPLATPAAALERLRGMRARKGAVAITFHDGQYPLTAAMVLTREHSGRPGAPVVLRAEHPGRVVFTGGVRLTALEPVTDPELLRRVPPEARQHVGQVRLAQAGVPDPGRLHPRGVGPEPKPTPALYWNDRPLTLARWPNEGWASTGRVLEQSGESFAFAFDGERPLRWTDEPNGWLFGYFGWLWADLGARLTQVSRDPVTLRCARAGGYEPREGMPWHAYNVLAELDRPGEWYLDSDRGVLIVYPPSPAEGALIEYPVLETALIQVQGASHIRFEGLTLELGRWNGIEMKDCSHVVVAESTICKLRGTAVTVEGGTRCGVFGSHLYALGRGGVSLKGGDRKTLQSSGHFVENCHIHDFSIWDRTYTPAAYVEGVGITVAHNLIHDSPGHAMRIEGNEHVIEYNEVHHVVTETDDQGALDMWYNPTYRGVVIRHNFWHHIGTPGEHRMRAGVRLDDAICGVLIYGNIFWKASQGYFGGVQIHGGKENEVVNNLFVDCHIAVSFSPWGAQRWQEIMRNEAIQRATRQDVDITQPPYSTRYPALSHLLENADVNRVWGNVALACGDFMARDGGIQQTADNVVAPSDPAAVTVRDGRLAIQQGADAFRSAGFRRIPLERIGPYPHPLALSTPRTASRLAR